MIKYLLLKRCYLIYKAYCSVLSMKRCLRLSIYFLNDRKRLMKYSKKYYCYAEKFDEACKSLDDLEEKIYEKRPDLREEAE